MVKETTPHFTPKRYSFFPYQTAQQSLTLPTSQARISFSALFCIVPRLSTSTFMGFVSPTHSLICDSSGVFSCFCVQKNHPSPVSSIVLFISKFTRRRSCWTRKQSLCDLNPTIPSRCQLFRLFFCPSSSGLALSSVMVLYFDHGSLTLYNVCLSQFHNFERQHDRFQCTSSAQRLS